MSVIPNIIVTCCALHNFILSKESCVDDIVHDAQEDDIQVASENILREETSMVAKLKRQEIMYLLT